MIKHIIFHLAVLLQACISTFALASLAELEKNALKELETFTYPNKEWVVPTFTSQRERIYDAIIVGGGQTGVGVALGLLKENVNNILLVDSAPAGMEGPWLTHARMEHLRTPKELTGPDCGLPSLTVRYWYEAVHGTANWNSLQYIPRIAWSQYLSWLKSMVKAPLMNNCTIEDIKWDELENCFVLTGNSEKEKKQLYSRKVVLATGMTGCGQWHIPDVIKNNISKQYYTQTAENIEFKEFEGKSVAVLGAGPNAFDCAIKLAENGAQVHLLVRQPKLALLNLDCWTHFCGLLHHYKHLPTQDKWRFLSALWCFGSPPTQESVNYAKTLHNFHFHFNSAVIDAKVSDGKVLLTMPHWQNHYDHVFVACGFETDLQCRKELFNMIGKIALWGDALQLDLENNEISKAPFLSPNYQFQEKISGTAPYLNSLFCLTGAVYPSNGDGGGGSIMGLKYAINACVNEITRQLFIEDFDALMVDFERYGAS